MQRPINLSVIYIVRRLNNFKQETNVRRSILFSEVFKSEFIQGMDKVNILFCSLWKLIDKHTDFYLVTTQFSFQVSVKM
jgi:hypothetical protein